MPIRVFVIDDRKKVLLLVAFSLACAATFFPFAFFRNDDWWILGNGVRELPKNWGFAFSPTLFFLGEEQNWFFRPLFKIFTLLFFKAFGFNYFLWLCGTLLFTVGAMWFGAKTIELVTNRSQSAFAYLLLFVASIQIYLGSVMWVGEGLMNCPQLFLLSLSLYLFCKHLLVKTSSGINGGLALLTYVVSIGFKESAVFHPLFMAALIFSERKFLDVTVERKIRALIPYVVLTGAFVIYRLFFLPVISGYIPNLSRNFLRENGPIILSALALPMMGLAGVLFLEKQTTAVNFLKAIFQRNRYLPFFLISVLPYLGQGFFSPGWLLGPGAYFLFLLALCIPQGDFSGGFFIRLAVVALSLSLPPVAWKLHNMEWWSWHKPQRQLFDIIRSPANEGISDLYIYDCDRVPEKNLGFTRVVGHDYGLHEAWRLHHSRDVAFHFMRCDAKPARQPADERALHLMWSFPELTVLGKAP